MSQVSASKKIISEKHEGDFATQVSRLREQIMGFRTTQIIATAASLNLAGHLQNGPRSAAQLAVATRTSEDSLSRLLRALTVLGIVESNANATFSLTVSGQLLRDDVPGSLRNVAILYGETWLWEAYAQLKYSIENNKPAFDHVHGQGLYEYLQQNNAAAEMFNKAMTAFSGNEAEAIKKAYDFSTARMIVDVGGGQGFLVASLLRAHPHLSGVVFDLPDVVNGIDKKSMPDRFDFVAGDFFRDIYSGGDVYILKSVLHNWENASSIAILKNCYRAMSPASRLLIIERVIPTEDTKSEAALFDINMLVMTNGRERTEAQYKGLLDASGFVLHRILTTESTVSIVECFRKV